MKYTCSISAPVSGLWMVLPRNFKGKDGANAENTHNSFGRMRDTGQQKNGLLS